MTFKFHHDPDRDCYIAVSGENAYVSFDPSDIECVCLESAQDAIDYFCIPVYWNQVPDEFREGFKEYFGFDGDDDFF
jgi:hypothetical protein